MFKTDTEASPFIPAFFRIKLKDDTRAILFYGNEAIRGRRIRRLVKDLHKIEAANSSDIRAFDHLLHLAYGRKGKARREFLEPALSNPSIATLPKIIPALETSHLPVYSSVLKALLMSPYSRTSKPLAPTKLSRSSLLPLRAEPLSEEAHLLGPFSKRRETNILWRFFKRETKKIYPPLKVVMPDPVPCEQMLSSEDLLRTPNFQPNLAFQSLGVYEDVEAVVGSSMPTPLTRKEKLASNQGQPDTPIIVIKRHPSRWVRRRYQNLLAKLPVLTFSPNVNRGAGGYTVGVSPLAISPVKTNIRALPEVDTVNFTWAGFVAEDNRTGHSAKVQEGKRAHKG